MFYEYEGYIIFLKRNKEIVEGKLRGNEVDCHYIVEWIDSEGQTYIGSIEDWEIKEAKQKGWLF